MFLIGCQCIQPFENYSPCLGHVVRWFWRSEMDMMLDYRCLHRLLPIWIAMIGYEIVTWCNLTAEHDRHPSTYVTVNRWRAWNRRSPFRVAYQRLSSPLFIKLFIFFHIRVDVTFFFSFLRVQAMYLIYFPPPTASISSLSPLNVLIWGVKRLFFDLVTSL